MPFGQVPLDKKNKENSQTKNQIRENVWNKGKDPHPQDKIQYLDLTKAPRPLYYKTPPCVFYHKSVRSKAVFGPPQRLGHEEFSEVGDWQFAPLAG